MGRVLPGVPLARFKQRQTNSTRPDPVSLLESLLLLTGSVMWFKEAVDSFPRCFSTAQHDLKKQFRIPSCNSRVPLLELAIWDGES